MSTIRTTPVGRPWPPRTRVAVTAGAVAALVAFVSTPLLFVPSPHVPTPSSAQWPFFVSLTAIEALALGAGIAFAIDGRRTVARRFSDPRRATAVHLAVVWALVSWWPHDGLHLVVGMRLGGLLGIEYGFHVTLMIGAAIVAWAFAREPARGSA